MPMNRFHYLAISLTAFSLLTHRLVTESSQRAEEPPRVTEVVTQETLSGLQAAEAVPIVLPEALPAE